MQYHEYCLAMRSIARFILRDYPEYESFGEVSGEFRNTPSSYLYSIIKMTTGFNAHALAKRFIPLNFQESSSLFETLVTALVKDYGREETISYLSKNIDVRLSGDKIVQIAILAGIQFKDADRLNYILGAACEEGRRERPPEPKLS